MEKSRDCNFHDLSPDSGKLSVFTIESPFRAPLRDQWGHEAELVFSRTAQWVVHWRPSERKPGITTEVAVKAYEQKPLAP
jgi:hypothetical protein